MSPESLQIAIKLENPKIRPVSSLIPPVPFLNIVIKEESSKIIKKPPLTSKVFLWKIKKYNSAPFFWILKDKRWY